MSGECLETRRVGAEFLSVRELARRNGRGLRANRRKAISGLAGFSGRAQAPNPAPSPRSILNAEAQSGRGPQSFIIACGAFREKGSLGAGGDYLLSLICYLLSVIYYLA